MEQIVKEYLEKAQSKERQIFEKERDDLLVKLGLTKDVVREYTELNYYSVDYPNWDPEKRKYYSEKPIPVEVSDEEYEEIKKYAKLSLPKEDVVEIFKDDVLDNGAESFLGGVNAVMLVVSIIVAIALFFSYLSEIGDGGGYIILGAILLILLSVISFYSVKVILNMSNNLHKINAKLK